jgi:hypothetical protein
MAGAHTGLGIVLVGCLATGEAGAEAIAGAATRELSFRVRIGRRALAASVRSALGGASDRLRVPACAAIFAEFSDGAGRTLQANLDALDQTGPGYLGLIGFYDGLGQARCLRERTLAITAAGSRAVWVCPQFAVEQRRDPGLAEVVLIHEALHSLGLGEDPPSAAEITSHVVKRCGR